MNPVTKNGLEDRVIARLQLEPRAVERARMERIARGRSLLEILCEAGAVDEADWARAIGQETGLAFRSDLDGPIENEDLLRALPMELALHHCMVPLGLRHGRLEVAFGELSAPGALALVDDLSFLYRVAVRPVPAPPRAVKEAISIAYDPARPRAESLLDTLPGPPLERLVGSLADPSNALDARAAGPLATFVNALLQEAIAARASDLHLEPFETSLAVRFRIDGLLRDVLSPPRHLHTALISRLKVMAGLDIAERRRPQDGRIRLDQGGRNVDARISLVPTVHGERAVLRLLDRSTAPRALRALGLHDDDRAVLERLLSRSGGMLLACGPTGSGKTTTLYAALAHIVEQDQETRNIITIEDPVEYQLRGIGQLQINPKIELTFAAGLRSVLRQDPDVIMVGEIRDRETAEIAIHAALTGHLVLSTLHTGDAPGAVTRLLDMGIEPFLVASALTAIVGQRLIRRLCPRCRVPADAEALRELLGSRTDEEPPAMAFSAGPGCSACSDVGYYERVGIYQLLRIDEPFRRLILQRSDVATLRSHARAAGTPGLRHHGAARVLDGTTSAEEVLRALRDEEADVP